MIGGLVWFYSDKISRVWESEKVFFDSWGYSFRKGRAELLK
jgi:hypothetical protein